MLLKWYNSAQMIKEGLLSILAKVPAENADFLADLSNENKTAISLATASVNLIMIYVFSRTMDGGLNSNWEKVFVGAATTGITAANVIVNHQIWT